MSIYNYSGEVIMTASTNTAVDNGCDNTGATNTSTAMQRYITANRFCYFPTGTYNIETQIFIPSNTFIFCEPNTIFKRVANNNNMFTSAGDSTITEYNGVHDVVIYGATFDVNGANYTYNCTAVSFIHAQRVNIENCQFINHTTSWHQIELSACKNCKVKDCYFDCTGKPSEAIQIESPYNGSAWPWSNGAIDDTPAVFNEVCGCTFYNGVVAVGNHGGGVANYTNIHDCVFDTFSEMAVQFYGGASNTVHDCTATDCTEFVRTQSATAYNNMIDGTFTA